MFKKYDAYKDSGVEWLGQLPSCWELLSNKYIFKLKKDLVGKKSKDYELLSLTLNGVIKRDMENPEGKFPAEFDTYQKVKDGDFIFCHFDVEETPRTVGLSTFNGMITGAYTVYEVDQSLFNAKFLYYFYLNLDVGKRLKPLYKGLRNTIGKDVFGEFKTFVPTKDEQRQIAEFLDQKTSEIDQAIAIKEQQIALLNERKQIVIQKAVTQGLNPNVAMKDSGVEWIGHIPEHWDLLKLKNLALVNPTNTTLVNSLDKKASVCFLAMESVETNGTVDYSHTRELASVRSGFTSFVKGDVLVAKITPCFENGKGAYLDTLQTPIGFGSTEFHVLRVKKNCAPKFLYYVTKSHSFMDMGEGLMIGSAGQKRVPTSFMQNYLVAIPDIETQIEIVNFIDQRLGEIAEAIDLQKKQIEKLKEYKTTLINDAVTGKIKVA